jgi:hypothetical protein
MCYSSKLVFMLRIRHIRTSRAPAELVRIDLFVDHDFTFSGAGIPEPGQMGGSRAAKRVRHDDMPTLWPRALHSRFAL